MGAESSAAQDPVLTPTSPASPSLACGQGEISQKEETVHGSDELSQNQKEEAVLGSDELSQKEEAVFGSDAQKQEAVLGRDELSQNEEAALGSEELCQKEEAGEEEGAPATAGECEDLLAKEELEWYNREVFMQIQLPVMVMVAHHRSSFDQLQLVHPTWRCSLVVTVSTLGASR